MAETLAARLGEVPQRDAIIRVVSQALASSTASGYGLHWARFVRFCVRQPDAPPPLPASTMTVLRWLAGDVCAHGKVQAQSLTQYTAAINRVHRDLELEPPARGHWVTAFRHGLAHERAESRSADRTYLPPTVVASVLEYALSGRALARSPEVLRACVCTVFTFFFFARGDTGAALLGEHVRRGPQGEWVIGH